VGTGPEKKIKIVDATCPLVREIHEEVRRISADGRQVVFLDIGSTLTNPDGTLSRDILPDWLHLSPKGYDLWARSLAPLLTSWLMP